MNANYAYPSTPTAAQPKRRSYLWLILVIVVVLACCCLVAAGVIVFADPFKLHIKDRLFGGTFDAAAQAMPQDTSIYVGVNLLGATPGELDRVIQPFADALKVDQNNWNAIIQELDKYFGENLDMTLTDDVKPWIGQYAGIGIFGFNLDDNNYPVSLIVALESRDNKAADNFLEKIRTSMEKSGDQTLEESTYQGITIYALQPEGLTGVAFCRSGSLVLFGLKESDLQAAIDAQKGKSLVDNSQYRDMLDKLPAKRVATIFVTSQQLEELFNEIQSRTGDVFGQISNELGSSGAVPQPNLANIKLDTWGDASIMSLSVTGTGLQFDSVTSYNLDNMSTAQRELLDSAGKTSKTVDMFPEDTLGFVTSQRLDRAYDFILETMRDISPDASSSIDNALQSVRESTGIDLEADLFSRLDGEFTIGVFPTSQGILAKQANVDLGFALLAESSDTGALANTMDTFASKMEEQGALVNRTTSGELSLYEFNAGEGAGTVFAGGIQKDYLSLASSSQTIEDLFAGNPPLSKSSRYHDAISPLPDGVTPVLYLDVEGIIGAIREAIPSDQRQSFDQGIKVLDPIPYLVVGTSSLNNGIVRTTFVIHVK